MGCLVFNGSETLDTLEWPRQLYGVKLGDTDAASVEELYISVHLYRCRWASVSVHTWVSTPQYVSLCAAFLQKAVFVCLVVAPLGTLSWFWCTGISSWPHFHIHFPLWGCRGKTRGGRWRQASGEDADEGRHLPAAAENLREGIPPTIPSLPQCSLLHAATGRLLCH